MIDYQSIYQNNAAQYDRLVTAEDYQNQLLHSLQTLFTIPKSDVLEIGTGTGRLTKLLLSKGARILGCDQAIPMLKIAQKNLKMTACSSASLFRANAFCLPVRDAWADAAIAGWVFGHQCTWSNYWKETIAKGLSEMFRALRFDGVLCLFETLGTGTKKPAPPNDMLKKYYDWLIQEHHFSYQILQTDYRFSSVEEAVALTKFFFGTELSECVRQKDSYIVPEYTGLWWKRKS